MTNNEAIIQATSHKPQATYNSALKILVCYHKPYTMPTNDDGILLPVHAGKALSNIDLHIQGDNEVNGQPCDNISDKNPTYCELTVMYWAWKNLKKLYPDVQYVGLFHYRRFLVFGKRSSLDGVVYRLEQEISSYKIRPDEIINIFNTNNIVLSTKIRRRYPINVDFCCNWSSFEEYATLKDVIKEKFPAYYDAFESFYELNNTYAPSQLFIMKYDDFVKYCEWLFSVLAEVEKRVTYRSRAIGYLGECLLSVYVLKKRMKPLYVDRYFFSDVTTEHISLLSKFSKIVRQIIKLCYYKVVFIMITLPERLRNMIGNLSDKNFPSKP